MDLEVATFQVGFYPIVAVGLPRPTSGHMQNIVSNPPFEPLDLQAKPVMNVVIVYENFEAGKHAKRTFDYLANSLGNECQLSSQMWKFDVLGIQKLRDMAAADALAADIIIVSSAGKNELPGPVLAWIDLWLEQKSNALALVALFTCPDEELEETGTVRSYLAEVARRGQMEFLAQPESGWGRETAVESRVAARIPEQQARMFTSLAGALQQDTPYQRWGIND